MYERAFPKDVSSRVIRALASRGGCEVMVSGAKVSYVLSDRGDFAAHLRESVGFDIAVADDLVSFEEPCLKIAAFYGDGVDPQEVERWRQLLENDCMVVASAPQWVDFVPIGLSKATALRVVLGRLGIDPADVVAFGDGPNDREVFELVGCPVAVTHADPDIIQRARYVTDTMEQALASILDGPGYAW